MAWVQNSDNVEVHVWPSERIKRNPRGATTKSPKDTKPALTATSCKYRYGPHGLVRHRPPIFESQPGLFHFIRLTLGQLWANFVHYIRRGSSSTSYHLMKLLILRRLYAASNQFAPFTCEKRIFRREYNGKFNFSKNWN